MFSSGVNDGSPRPLIIHLLPSPHKLFITGRHLTVQWTRQSSSDSRRRPVRHRKNIKNPIISIVIITVIVIVFVIISTGLPAIRGFTSCGVRVAEVESRSYRHCATVIFAKIKQSHWICGFQVVASCWASGVTSVCEIYLSMKGWRRGKFLVWLCFIDKYISLKREHNNVQYEAWVGETKHLTSEIWSPYASHFLSLSHAYVVSSSHLLTLKGEKHSIFGGG